MSAEIIERIIKEIMRKTNNPNGGVILMGQNHGDVRAMISCRPARIKIWRLHIFENAAAMEAQKTPTSLIFRTRHEAISAAVAQGYTHIAWFCVPVEDMPSVRYPSTLGQTFIGRTFR